MDNQTAISLIEQTFNNPFDESQFRNFVINLLNDVDETKAFKNYMQGQYIKDSFKGKIRRYKRLGTYTDPDGEKLDILVIHIEKEASIERARTMLRNFVSTYLKERGEKEAALVAFYSDNPDHWRFSYIKMEYQLGLKENGKINIKTEITPAKRYSFLVGAEEPCHTAKIRLLPILKETNKKPTLISIEDAFSVERVTKEFFVHYRSLLIWVKKELDNIIENNSKVREDFETKSINTVDFSKKLLGQIVFLYFLQKKGWFGVERDNDWGNGSKRFLRDIFSTNLDSKTNYYNDVLEPLFYEALRVDRSHDDDYYKLFNCKIPFLNGGLFDPIGNYDWVHTDINLPNYLFSNNDESDEGIPGTGILDVFDRYNFTVKETEPLEKEVAIDPELLGKAYEKFNAIRSDNFDEYISVLKSSKKGAENKFNKKFGVYYTPREVVHFMCQQSLIEYLNTELNNIVSADAISFLVLSGDKYIEYLKVAKDKKELNENYNGDYRESKLFIELKSNSELIDNKLATIRVCDPAIGSGAFPVEMMNEIINARMFFVKTDSISSRHNNQNNDSNSQSSYTFKRNCIENTLYGVDIDPGAVEIAKLRLWLSLIVDEEDIKQIKPLPNLEYKIVCGNSLLEVEKDFFNEEHINILEELKPKYLNTTNPKLKSEYKSQIDDLFEKVSKGSDNFDFMVRFSEVYHEKDGFDLVIANPPYGAEISAKDKTILKVRYNHMVERIRNSFLYFLGLADRITKNGGHITYIIPNEFLFQIYMTKARRHFLNNRRFLYAINVGEDVFEAIVPTCLIGLKKEKIEDYPIQIADFRNMSLKDLDIQLQIRKFDNYPKKEILKSVNSIFSFNVKNTNLVNSLISKHKSFNDFCESVSNGISTGCDDVYIVDDDLVKSMKFEKTYVKPTIYGGLLNRFYCPIETNERLLYIDKNYDNSVGKNIFKYLKKNRDLLISKSVEKRNGKRPWFILFRSRKEKQFIIPKIMIRQTGDSIIAALDSDVGYYCIDSVNIAQLNRQYKKYIEYFLGLLNSKLINFIYRQISQEGGRVLAQVKPQRIRALPIVFPEEKQMKVISDIVMKIINAKQINELANTSDLEDIINQEVYQLYELTQEEIAIVEEGTL